MACLSNLTLSSKLPIQVQTSIGDLYLFNIKVKDLISIEKTLGRNLEEFTSEDFFRLCLPFFAYFKEDLVGESLERPEKYTLKSDEIKKLSKDELEKIAKVFLEKNGFLFTDIKNSIAEQENGIPFNDNIDKFSLKQDNESYLECVHRLVSKKLKKEQERLKNIFSSFSSSLSNDILKTMRIGDTLKNSIGSLSRLSNTTKAFSSISENIEPIKYELPTFDPLEMVRKQEKMRLAPFKDLSSKMDSMIEAERQTVSFMNDVYNAQVQISSELKISSDSANENSKLNIKYTQFIIFLTVISTLITALAFAYPVWFDNNSEKVIKTNEDIQSSITETNKKLEKLTEVLIKQNEIQNEQIKILSDEIKKSKLPNNPQSMSSK